MCNVCEVDVVSIRETGTTDFLVRRKSCVLLVATDKEVRRTWHVHGFREYLLDVATDF